MKQFPASSYVTADELLDDMPVGALASTIASCVAEKDEGGSVGRRIIRSCFDYGVRNYGFAAMVSALNQILPSDEMDSVYLVLTIQEEEARP